MAGERRGPYILLAIVVVAHLALTFRYHVPLDDAYISFRYSNNLARGHGLTWNPGERVEGFTNFLWTVILGGLIRLGVDPLAAATVLGSLATTACVLLGYRLTRALGGERWTAVAVAAAIGLQGPLAFAAGSGMESAAFAAVVALAALLVVRGLDGHFRWAGCGLALAVAALLRPEGALVFALTAAVLFLTRERRGDSIRMAAVFSAVFVPFLAWRFWYYGELVPNTAHAKVDLTLAQLDNGLRYVGDWLMASGGAALALVPFAFARARRAATYLLALALLYATYLVYVGGDILPMFRFLLPMLPLLAALVGVGFVAALPAGRARLVAGLLLVTVVVLPSLQGNPNLAWLKYRDKAEENAALVKMGTFFGESLPPGSVISTGVIGALGYHSDLPLIDTFGLTDRTIARSAPDLTGGSFIGHQKGDGAYVLDRRPDYFLPCELIRVTPRPLTQTNPAALRQMFRFKTEREMWENPEFHRLYQLVSLPFDGGYVNLYALRDGKERQRR